MKSNLERMLREVQELKRQNFGIPLPTKDAYRFVKSQEAYEGLRKGVAERLKAEGRRCNLTRRNVANLCDSILDFASQALDQVAKRTAASQPNNNYMPKDLHLMAFNPLLESSRDYLEKLNEKVIDFDYETLIYYYVKASEDANPEEAFRIAFREFYDGDHQFLIIEERKMSYPEFCKDANLHLEQNPGLDREDMGYDENEEQIREFESWLNQGSDFMNKKINPERITDEERKFLYGFSDDGLRAYQRAEIDQTLKRVDTERQLALHYIIGNEIEGPNPVNKAIDTLVHLIKISEERKKDFIRKKVPKLILDNEERIINERKETYLAIKKNSRWLVEILSR